MATGSNYPNSLDSWSNKTTADQLTPTDVNQRSSALEKIESYINSSAVFLGLRPLVTAVASSSNTVDFTSTYINSNYDAYFVTMTGVVPATSGSALTARLSIANVFQIGGSDYQNTLFYNADGGAMSVAGSASAFAGLAYLLSNTAGRIYDGSFWFFNPARDVTFKLMMWDGVFNTGSCVRVAGGATYHTGTDTIDAIRFLMNAGAISKGTFTLYGLRRD